MELKTENELRILIAYNDYDVFNEYFKSLEREMHNILEQITYISGAAAQFSFYGIKYDKTSYENEMDKLHEELNTLRDNASIFAKYLYEKQENCKHEWVDNGHDSHYTYYKCTKCGKECRE